MYNLKENVKRGAELLDKEEPDWYRDIDVGTLQLESCGRCVLGQLFGDYSFGLDTLLVSAYDHGFCLPPGLFLADGAGWEESNKLWKELTDAWIDEIKARCNR